MTMSQTALAANYAVSAIGSTYINNVGCQAAVSAYTSMPVYYDVTYGDTVTVYLNYTYTDVRTGHDLPPAHHIFTQFVYYLGWGETEAYEYNTTQETFGSGSIQMIRYVQPDSTMYVKWWTNVTCGSQPQCTSYDSDDGYIYLT